MSYEEIFERFKEAAVKRPTHSASFLIGCVSVECACSFEEVIAAVSVVHAMNAARGQWEKNDPPKVEGT